LTFLSNPKYTEYIYTTKASIVLVNNTFVPEKPIDATLIKVEDAYKSLALLLNMVEQSKAKKTGVDSLAFVSPSAKIGENVYIGPFVYIGEHVVIGDNTRIHPHVCLNDNVNIGSDSTLFSGVKIYENCLVGNRCILHSGAVVGSDGFGFAPNPDGSYNKIAQIGNVVIEDDVEIGANSTIDCATMGSTIIRKGVKLDNLVHLAHNVEVGENTAMAAQCGVSGSSKIGKNCILAGQVGIAGHLNIADRNIFGAKSGVPSSIKTENGTWIGAPILEVRNFRRTVAVHKHLPELQQTVLELQKELNRLKEIIENK
jgi:UDP-3-O-[3-hydroxymyristoyl] glucosamine N-acyltransferase